MTTQGTEDANQALRELLIAAADWRGSTEFSSEDRGDSLARFSAAAAELADYSTPPPDPGAVLRSLGWKR